VGESHLIIFGKKRRDAEMELLGELFVEDGQRCASSLLVHCTGSRVRSSSAPSSARRTRSMTA